MLSMLYYYNNVNICISIKKISSNIFNEIIIIYYLFYYYLFQSFYFGSTIDVHVWKESVVQYDK